MGGGRLVSSDEWVSHALLRPVTFPWLFLSREFPSQVLALHLGKEVEEGLYLKVCIHHGCCLGLEVWALGIFGLPPLHVTLVIV